MPSDVLILDLIVFALNELNLLLCTRVDFSSEFELLATRRQERFHSLTHCYHRIVLVRDKRLFKSNPQLRLGFNCRILNPWQQQVQATSASLQDVLINQKALGLSTTVE